MRECEGCFQRFKRKEVMPVATFRRGILWLCKDCARRDREMAERKLKPPVVIGGTSEQN